MIGCLSMEIRLLFFRAFFLFCLLLGAMGAQEDSKILQRLKAKYEGVSAHLWGENLRDVITRIPTSKPYVFLTLDLCGGGYDKRITDLLIEQKIPAMIFVNARWIDAHQQDFMHLAGNALFSIQNHGFAHKPLSSNGRSIYGIQGTKNITEIYDEVMKEDAKIFALTTKHPRFFRSGTAYYDEVALKVLQDLGYRGVGFDVLGDGGATFSKAQIIKQADLVKNGSILIYHLNHPEKATFDGLREVIKILKNRGFVFKNLNNFL